MHKDWVLSETASVCVCVCMMQLNKYRTVEAARNLLDYNCLMLSIT